MPIFKTVEHLVGERGHKPSCVCGTSKGAVIPVATRRVNISGFEVNKTFGEATPIKKYFSLEDYALKRK